MRLVLVLTDSMLSMAAEAVVEAVDLAGQLVVLPYLVLAAGLVEVVKILALLMLAGLVEFGVLTPKVARPTVGQMKVVLVVLARPANLVAGMVAEAVVDMMLLLQAERAVMEAPLEEGAAVVEV